MSTSDLQAALDRACDAVRGEVGQGRVADYIPALARVSPDRFGAAIVTIAGETALYGDAEEPFSIQSVSKVFTLTKALARIGDDLWRRVGREPSGDPFNSIVQLEYEHGIPRNPFINAGAIVVSDALLGSRDPAAAIADLVSLMRYLPADDSIDVDPEVAASERDTGFRNRALANFMKGFGNLDNDVDRVLDVYFHQCAIVMSCVQLARAALLLAADGFHPLSDRRLLSPELTRRVNSIMLMCGHYDASGDFAYRVGLPGKSGVGGGIVAVVPDRAAIAVWSPALNASGNSHAGTAALERIVHETGWTVF